jgi:hypothetical protein
LRLSEAQRSRLLVSLAAPAVAVAAVVAFRITQAPTIEFTPGSNIATSGGTLPNQVSASLGLGAMVAGLLALGGGGWLFRACMGVAVLALGAQSALTFSRGGLYMAAGGLAVAALFMLRDPRTLIRTLILGAAAATLAYTVILPRLDRLTDGMLAERFRDTGTTGRAELVVADLKIWEASPIVGVGPGGATARREPLVGKVVVSHVEFSRLLAEHGLFGVGALLVMAAMALRALRRAAPRTDRGPAAAMLTWSALFMLTAAMRLVAPAFVFGLAAARTKRGSSSRRDGHPVPADEYRRVA